MAFPHKKIDAKRLPDTVLEKWGVQVLDEGFVPFPKRLLRCLAGLFDAPNGIHQLQAVLAVVDFRRPYLLRNPSIEFLAHTAGLTVEQFRQAVAELRRRGLVTTAGPDEAIEINIDALLHAIQRQTADPTEKPSGASDVVF